MKPEALKGAQVVGVLDGGALELMTSAGRLVLAPLEAAVWQAADGQRDVAALARVAQAALGQPVETWEVFGALDVLGEQGLLVAEASAPPATMGRRDALRWMGQATGAAVMLMLGVTEARAQDEVKAEASAEELAEEKLAEEKLPADAPVAKKRKEEEAKARVKARRAHRQEEDIKRKESHMEQEKKRDSAQDKRHNEAEMKRDEKEATRLKARKEQDEKRDEEGAKAKKVKKSDKARDEASEKKQAPQ